MKKLLRLSLGFIFLVMLYLYVHNPILPFGIGSVKLLYPFALLFIFFKVKTFSRYLSLFRTECILLLLLIVYSVFEFLFSGEPDTMRLHIVGFMEYFVLPFFLIQGMRLPGGKEEDHFIRFMLITACVGAVITTACLLVPSFNEFVRSTANAYVLESMDEFRASTSYRGFGISEDLTYSYGIVQAIFFAITLYCFKDHKWVLPFSFLILLSVALNARTGLVVVAFGLIVFLVGKGRGAAILVLLGLIVIFANMVPILNLLGIAPETLDWLEIFVEETGSIFKSKSLTASVTTSYLFDELIVLPRDAVEWLFGCGRDIYWSLTRRSDMGWIIQLNYGGLCYMALELALLATLFVRLSKAGYAKMAVFFALAFAVANTKGPALPNSGIFRLMMLFYVYYMMTAENRRRWEIRHS